MKYNDKELDIIKGAVIRYISHLFDTCEYKLLPEKQMTKTDKIHDLGYYCAVNHSISINRESEKTRPILIHEMLELLMSKIYQGTFVQKLTDDPTNIEHFLVSHEVLDKTAKIILK